MTNVLPEGADIRYSASEDMSHACYLPNGIVEKSSRKYNEKRKFFQAKPMILLKFVIIFGRI